MTLPEVRVTGRGFKLTDEYIAYVNSKIKKNERVFSAATAISVEFVGTPAARGVDADFTVEVMMTLPNRVVRVEKRGADMHAIVDESMDVLLRKVKRYKDTAWGWEARTRKFVAGIFGKSRAISDAPADVVDYVPKIVDRKKLENCSPMDEAEAVEQMELLGSQCFLFKNSKTGKYCVVYLLKKGGYGIIEACE